MELVEDEELPKVISKLIDYWKDNRDSEIQRFGDFYNCQNFDNLKKYNYSKMSLSKYLQELENESIYILREVVAEFFNPVMLYSVGKDSSVMLRLAQKAFYPSKIPFPLLHVDTGYKFKEMYEFRDELVSKIGANLIIHRNEKAIEKGMHPAKFGVAKCCGAFKNTSIIRCLINK